VVQNYRYYRCVERALERVGHGALGQVVSLTGFAPTRFPVSWTRSTWLYEQGGVLLDFAPHVLDLFVLFAAAPARRVVTFGRDISGGDMGFMNYCQVMVEFDGGVLASLDSSWVTGANMFAVGIHGTGGHIDLDVRNDYYREYHGTYTPFDDVRDLRGRAAATVRRLISGEYFRGPMVFYEALLRDFLASVDAGRATSPRVSTLAQGLNCAAVLVTALESASRGTVLDLDVTLGAAAASALRGLYEAA
jgi:predicted dehydrogenase